jgi:hypothetical protein
MVRCAVEIIAEDNCYGKTPLQTFLDSKHLAHAKVRDGLTALSSPDNAA